MDIRDSIPEYDGMDRKKESDTPNPPSLPFHTSFSVPSFLPNSIRKRNFNTSHHL
jgi:hypothetical protein